MFIKFFKKNWLPLFTTSMIFVIWELGIQIFGVPEYIAPAPSSVFATLVEERDTLWRNFLPTLFESLAGFVVGNFIAITLAIAFVHNKMVEKAFFPIAVFVNTIPILAVAPVLVLIFGNGIETKVIIAALICFFPTLVNMVRGLESVSGQMIELGRILSATKPEFFWKIRLQSSLPFLFSALKIASTTCVIGAIVGEWVGADIGLGSLIIEATFNFRSPLLYATVIVSSGLAVILFISVSVAERLIIKWKPEHSV
ncbi:MAG: ABC transporter permease [Rhizobiales bacterium]|nr:ABC transporter permease [Hyphomicrobiales bacterium]NRB15478.1 ABC transporter permease [Hyphomicrobiales bacterium]